MHFPSLGVQLPVPPPRSPPSPPGRCLGGKQVETGGVAYIDTDLASGGLLLDKSDGFWSVFVFFLGVFSLSQWSTTAHTDLQGGPQKSRTPHPPVPPVSGRLTGNHERSGRNRLGSERGIR